MFVNASYVVSDVANVLNLSERQVQRLMNRFRQNGASGLIHQSRGKPSNNHISSDYRYGILKLVRKYYADLLPRLLKNNYWNNTIYRFQKKCFANG